MRFKISFRIADGLLRIEQSGDFDVDAYIALIVEVLAHPDYRLGMPAIADVTGTRRHVTVPDMEVIREALVRGPLKAFRPRRYALVATAPMYGLIAKLLSEVIVETTNVLSGVLEIRRFATHAEAEAWVRGA